MADKNFYYMRKYREPSMRCQYPSLMETDTLLVEGERAYLKLKGKLKSDIVIKIV